MGLIFLADREPNCALVVAYRLAIEQIDLRQERRAAMLEASADVREGIDFLAIAATRAVRRAREL